MQLEFHQLDRRWEHLRARRPERQRRLLASLATSGQQTPIVVVAIAGQVDRYLVIDGYQRIAALQQLGRDTVDAVVWAMNEVEALVLDRSLRWAEHETAWKKAGCWRNWNNASAMVSTIWHVVLIQPELGIAASGTGRSASGKRAAASTRRRDHSARGDEVLGPGSTREPGRLPAHGRRVCGASVHQPRGRPLVCRLAKRCAGDPAAHSRATAVVSESPAAT